MDNKISKVLQMKRFMVCKGFLVKINIIYQDSISSINMEENGKDNSVTRTCHFNINYFYVTDLIGRNEVKIDYCPTYEIIAYYMI